MTDKMPSETHRFTEAEKVQGGEGGPKCLHGIPIPGKCSKCEHMMSSGHQPILRDESTAEGRRIWEDVEAAAREAPLEVKQKILGIETAQEKYKRFKSLSKECLDKLEATEAALSTAKAELEKERRAVETLADSTAALLRRAEKAEAERDEARQKLSLVEGNDDHPENRCDDCGGRNIRWFVANELWNQYARSEKGDPMLCPICFVRRAEKEGENPPSWRLGPEREQRNLEVYLVGEVENERAGRKEAEADAKRLRGALVLLKSHHEHAFNNDVYAEDDHAEVMEDVEKALHPTTDEGGRDES